MGDSEIARLSRQIYYKHRRALDLIYEHRPDAQEEIKVVLEDLIKHEPGLKLDRNSKTQINFANSQWDRPVLLTARGWSSSGRVLLFEFRNDPNKLNLSLVIGPGLDVARQKLYEMARTKPTIFETSRKLAPMYSKIFSRTFLRKEMYEEVDHEERELEIRTRWAEFLEKDLPQVDAALQEERWIWVSDETGRRYSD